MDYRNLTGGPKPLMIPPPMPNQTLLSPATPMKSPAQQRWNTFKENNPTDFVHDMERKRLRDAQFMQSQDSMDEDLRLTPMRKQPPPLMAMEPSRPIPKVRFNGGLV